MSAKILRSQRYKPFGHRQSDIRYPAHTSWQRTHQIQGRNALGKEVTREITQPKRLTFCWGPLSPSEINERIRENAAPVLGCRVKDVVLWDQGELKYCWIRNGSASDVVTYRWTGGAK